MMTRSKTRSKRAIQKMYRLRLKQSNCRGKKTGCTKKIGCKKTRSGKRKTYCRRRTNRRA